MRIGIDARFLGPEGTGFGRYVEKLIENLEVLDRDNEYFIFLRKDNFHLYSPKNPNFQKVLADAKWYSLKEQVIMPSLLRKYKLDLVHFPAAYIPVLYQGKFVVTTHDMTKINFREKAATTHKLPIYFVKHLAFTATFRQALSRAQKVITPSKYVKDDLVKVVGVPEKKIVVTYEGADNFLEEKFVASEGKVKEVFSKFAIKKPYLLYVGNAYPHKNLERLIESLVDVDPQVKLVCVIKRDIFLERLITKAESLGVRSRLVFTGGVTDDDLRLLFNQAQALVFPSLSEGFGLPGLEAMALDCPVICSDVTSLPEIYGEAAVYFDPYDTADIAGKINSVLNSEKLRLDLIKKGRVQVQKFSWKKMAEETLKIYAQILAEH